MGDIIKEIIASIWSDIIISNKFKWLILILLHFLWGIIHHAEKVKQQTGAIKQYEEYIKNNGNDPVVRLLKQSSSKIKKPKNFKHGIYLMEYQIFSAFEHEIKKITSTFIRTQASHFGIILVLSNNNSNPERIRIKICIDHQKTLVSRHPIPLTLSPQSTFIPKLFIDENEFNKLKDGKHKIELWANHKKVISDYFYINNTDTTKEQSVLTIQ